MRSILNTLFIVILFTSFSSATRINVPADIDSIQGGIDLANDGDTVLVDVGTYNESITFNGKAITVGSLFLITNDKSYISKTVIDGSEVFTNPVKFENGEDSTTILSGFTITNGTSAAGACGPMNGCTAGWAGGISCNNSKPTLTNLRIIGNSFGIYLVDSSPKLINVTITKNSGHGISFIGNSHPSFDPVNRCNIYSNYSRFGQGSDLFSSEETINIKVTVDTFSVSNPTNYNVEPLSNFTIDMENAKYIRTNSDLYVSPEGNDDNSGLSREEPLRTILVALIKIKADSLNPHTIYLANGNYIASMNIERNIGLFDYISILGESRAGVILNSYSLGSTEKKFGSIENMTIKSGEITVRGYSSRILNPIIKNVTIIGDGKSLGISCEYANVLIKNVSLFGARMVLTNGSSHIENLKISGNIDEQEEALCIGGSSSTTLMNTMITDNSGYSAIFCRGSSHLNMINCTISSNKSLSLDSVGVLLIEGSSSLIVNSIIWDNLPYEIGYLTNSSMVITNSLLKSGRSSILGFDGENNLDWRDGNIDTNPMFVDHENGDYRLQQGSLCIDAGIQDTFLVYNNGQDTLYIPPMDYIGSAPDMGAYEYGDPAAIEPETVKLPNRHTLHQNYPNPFNPSTTINFSLPKSEYVELKVFNILGKEVTTLVSNKLNQGNHTYQFDGKNLASGIYYYQLIAGDYREVKKMILLR